MDEIRVMNIGMVPPARRHREERSDAAIPVAVIGVKGKGWYR